MAYIKKIHCPKTRKALTELGNSDHVHLTPQNSKSGWATLVVLEKQGFNPHAILILIDIGPNDEILGMTQMMPCLPVKPEHIPVGHFPVGIQNSAPVSGYPGESGESAIALCNHPNLVQWVDLVEIQQNGADVFVVFCENGSYFYASFRANGDEEIQSKPVYVDPGPLEQMADELRLKFWHGVKHNPDSMGYMSWIFGKDTTLIIQHSPSNDDDHSNPQCTACYGPSKRCSVHTCPDCAQNHCRHGIDLTNLGHDVSLTNRDRSRPRMDWPWIERICQNRQLPMLRPVISVWLLLLLIQAGPSTPSSPALSFFTSASEARGVDDKDEAAGQEDQPAGQEDRAAGQEDQAAGQEDQGGDSGQEDRGGDSGQDGATDDVQSDPRLVHYVLALKRTVRTEKYGPYLWFHGVPPEKPVLKRDTRVRVSGNPVDEDEFLNNHDKFGYLEEHQSLFYNKKQSVSRIGTVVGGHDLSFAMMNTERPLETQSDPNTDHVCEYILKKVGGICYELTLYAVRCTGDEEPGLYLADQLEVCEGALGGFPGGARQDPPVTQARASEDADEAHATEEGDRKPAPGRVKRKANIVYSSDDGSQESPKKGKGGFTKKANNKQKQTATTRKCGICGQPGHYATSCTGNGRRG